MTFLKVKLTSQISYTMKLDRDLILLEINYTQTQMTGQLLVFFTHIVELYVKVFTRIIPTFFLIVLIKPILR